jgi:hypothetical protein
MSDNIEERIKDTIKSKLRSNDSLDEKTTALINKLFEIIPGLKEEAEQEKKPQVETTASGTENENENNEANEIPLEEIMYNDTLYHKDNHGGIWDINNELVGVYNKGNIAFFSNNDCL